MNDIQHHIRNLVFNTCDHIKKEIYLLKINHNFPITIKLLFSFPQILLLLSLAAIVAADSRKIYRPTQSSQETSESSEESYESSEAKYSFNWAVSDDSSSNEFGHQEARDGDHTQGSYYVQLPDGRLQTVKYFVDGDSGYVAEVNYEGEVSDESNSSESEEDVSVYES
ncbi:cuticle protein-like [Penaeus chinensis]|uniref:cuticle protein-like n=1 Tax=Penaeus chinensis TaxID=139456 RepID=UPI001FB63EB0|nr:cuticle protein-like [Penaeus chinensis]